MDLFAGKVGGQAILPVLMLAFHFAFGLRRGRVTESHPVKAQGPAQLCDRFGRGTEEKRVVIDVKRQGQAKICKSLGQEIEIGKSVSRS